MVYVKAATLCAPKKPGFVLEVLCQRLVWVSGEQKNVPNVVTFF
jgi:hypothetical protein